MKSERNDEIRNREKDTADKAYELISLSQAGQDITIRDDQNDFSSLLDAVRICRSRGRRFRLVDSGVLDIFHLEWLGEAGADIYSSDEARTITEELDLIRKSCRRGHAITAYFCHGPFNEGAGGSPDLFRTLKQAGRIGIYLHLSNRERKRDGVQLEDLARACRQGGSRLIYYHHGKIEPSLKDLARSGAWIHVSDTSFPDGEAFSLLMDVIEEGKAGGSRLILHVEKGLSLPELKDIFEAGAHVLFKTPPSDRTSPLRSLEKKARKKKLDFRAYYLYTTILP